MQVAARVLEALRRSHKGARCGASLFTSSITQQRGFSQRVTEADNVKPLEGVKILDLTRVLAGPFATMILGDLGAEIIKVEKPGSGDDTRSWGPPFVGTESNYFLSVNRNKKSIAVNMKDPKGTKIIQELAQVCDVLIENYIPGKLAEMGLGYEDVKKSAPHIIYCSITGYGQSGPLFQRAGYDAVACAMSGLMHITGPEDGDPVRPGVAMTDLATGLYAHGAIMAGLLQKSKTGKGMHIDCNLLSSQFPTTPQEWQTVAADFSRRWNFPNCGGAIDGKHVRIVPPPHSGSHYFNYKGFHSVVLMAVVSANYEFLYLDVGKNGRMSDGGVFAETEFAQRLLSEDLGLPPAEENEEGLPFVFVADEAFALGPHLMRPFPQRALTPERRVFNYRLARARRVVENAFGIMASRFRLFLTAINLAEYKLNYIITCCCILHNYLRRHSSTYLTLLPDDPVDIPEAAREAAHPQLAPRNARAVRQAYVDYFMGRGAIPMPDLG